MLYPQLPLVRNSVSILKVTVITYNHTPDDTRKIAILQNRI